MKLNQTKRTLMTILVIALAIPDYAQAQDMKEARSGERKAIKAELNLSEEQQEQMEELRFSHEKSMISMRSKVQLEQLELKKLKRADEPNKKKIHAQIDKVGAAKTAISKTRADHQLEIRKVLTEDQYKIFRKGMHMKAERREGRRDGARKSRKHRDGPNRP